MSIDQATLASRLRQARDDAGLTQEQAAEILKLPRTAIVQIESGNRTVSSLELARMSETYRRDMADFFEADMPSGEAGPFLVLHRLSAALESDPDVKREVERCIDICREGAALEDILNLAKRNGPPLYNLPAPRSIMDAVRQGQQVAEQERLRLGMGDGPIPDMSDLLNSVGVWASGVRLPESMSGLYLSDPEFGPVILVNCEHPRARKRFSYAHEYAHALLDRDLKGNVSERDNSGDLREKRANAFAAAFLMPEGGTKSFIRDLNKGQPSRQETPVFDVAGDQWSEASLRPAPGSQTLGYQDVAILASHFRVSYAAAVYRLKSLGLIGPTESNELMEKQPEVTRFIQFLGLFDPEELTTDKADRELVAQVAHLAIEAYRQDEISRGRILEIAKILRRDGAELLRFAQASRKD